MLALYRGATVALAPFAKLYLERRSRAGKEDSARLEERFGRAARARPAGALIWLHAASVGESGVALQIVEALREALPEAHFLITTGTRTSADLVSKRALAHTTHAYVPLDTIDGARAFLAHWRPDLGVFVESEIWPNLLLEAKAAGVKLALVNARMSSATLQRWSSWRDSGRALFSAFDLITAADARTAEGLADILGRDVRCAGNLKLAATAPKVDLAARAEVLAQIDRRTV
jgi:3-deoxy-D-manno-octulosonic-acid transferase